MASFIKINWIKIYHVYRCLVSSLLLDICICQREEWQRKQHQIAADIEIVSTDDQGMIIFMHFCDEMLQTVSFIFLL